MDGYGTWLWALSEHVAHWGTKSLVDELGESLELACSYLEAVALDPCYDCWEENGQAVHTSTLACVYGGLSAAGELLGRPAAARKAEEVAEHILARMRSGAGFAKSSVDRGVDASLLWLAVPFGVVGPADTAMAATASEIEAGLVLEGGIRRYARRQLLRRRRLAAAYGVARLVPGQRRRPGYRPPVRLLGRSTASTPPATSPSRSAATTATPAAYRTWVSRWGPPAADLAWSHAMYFVLWDELQRLGAGRLDLLRACHRSLHQPAGSRPASGGDSPRRQGGRP